MEKKIVKIFNMRAVGMHHWGPPSLTIGDCYSLQWEPDCVYDIPNAMAIYDNTNIKRAYIARDDARILSRIWSQGMNMGALMGCKPLTNLHVVLHSLGPQHECTIAFKAMGRDIMRVETLLKAANVQYEMY